MFFSATNQLNALQPLETKRYSKYSKIALHATQLFLLLNRISLKLDIMFNGLLQLDSKYAIISLSAITT